MKKVLKRGIGRGLTNYGDPDFSRYIRRAFAKSMGYSDGELDRPIIGIANSGSGFNSCHQNFDDLTEALKRGILSGGGIPIEFPTISLGEIFTSPTTMMFRNLMAMDTEEMIRAQPMDGVVLLGGCDKTVPAQLMGAISVDIPTICLVAGPMMTGTYQGERLGACTDCRQYWIKYRADEVDSNQIETINDQLCATTGTCMVMGTASTMAALAEALGLMLPGGASIPAVMADRRRQAEATGRTLLDLVAADLTPSRILDRRSFENAITVLMAIGGSTNAVIHLTAIAKRAGIQLTLNDFDHHSKITPVLVDVKPNGQNYMEDLWRSGGIPIVMKEIEDLLQTDVMTVTGSTVGQNLARVETPSSWQKVIRPRQSPLVSDGGLVPVFGNLAPDGAIIKKSAASPHLLHHRGPAIVFDSVEDLYHRLDDPDLPVTQDHVLVLRNVGPIGGPGMPEVGNLSIPKKLLQQGIRDMVRISDARMSGTAFGTIVLHVAPESAIGGPLALVEDGDLVELDVVNRKLDLHLPEQVLAQRRENLILPSPHFQRGYGKLFQDHVEQADQGCDFDFLSVSVQLPGEEDRSSVRLGSGE
jgi:dihydroxy-acid dehydratase